MQADHPHQGFGKRMCGRLGGDGRSGGSSLRNEGCQHRPPAHERDEQGRKPGRGEEPRRLAQCRADHLTSSKALASTESTTQSPVSVFTTVYFES